MTSLKKNFTYSSILTTANYIFPLLTYPYVSRVLGVTNIGICNFVDSIVNYFILFSMMGMSIVGIREIAKCRGDRKRLNEVFSSLFFLNSLSTSVVLVILCISIFMVPKFGEYKELMLFGVLKLMFNYLNIEWLYKGMENFRYITVRSILVKCAYVVCVFVFVHEQDDYALYYGLLCGMTIINGIINILYARRSVSFTPYSLSIKPYVRPFLVLGLYLFLTSMYTSFNVAYLGFMSGEVQVGYYTTATKLYTILLALFSALTGVLMPRMSSFIAEGRMTEFVKLQKKAVDVLLAFSFPVIALSTILAPQIISLISGAGYEGAIVPMRIVMPLVFIIGYEQILIIQVLMPLKEDKAILRNSIIGASIGLLMNILLVGTMQSIGSALVWVASEIAVLLSAQFFLAKRYHIHFPLRRASENFVYHAPLCILIYYTSLWVNSPLVVLAASAAITALYCVVLQVFILKNEICVGVYNKMMRTKFSLVKK